VNVPPSAVRGISDDGAVVGIVDGRPYMWRADGRRQALAVPNGATVQSVVVRGQRALGRVSVTHGGQTTSTAAAWDLRSGSLQVVQGLDAVAMLTNGVGWLLLWISDAVLVKPTGQAVRLPVPGGGSLWPSIPVWFSDDGRTIVGNVPKPGGGFRAATWRCQPW
jgi:hypothetical protein